MKKVLSRILLFFTLSIVIFSCASKQYFAVSDPGFDFKSNYCNLQSELKKKTVKTFHRSGVLFYKGSIIHIQVVFRGKGNSFIGIVNCNASFQAPVFLCFYDESFLKVITDSFDLDLLYSEYLSFVQVNELQNKEEIWTYIETFSKKELFNKYNKINF